MYEAVDGMYTMSYIRCEAVVCAPIVLCTHVLWSGIEQLSQNLLYSGQC